jgi:hypothetical protein
MVPAMETTFPKPSAGLLTSGVTMVLVGVPLLLVAMLAGSLDQASRDVAAVLGWFLAAPGLGLIVVGVFRLARNVDLAAGVWQRPAPAVVLPPERPAPAKVGG